MNDELTFCLLFHRKDIIARYNKEKKIAIGYMTMVQSRVAITTDMWTADNQKKGYMTVTGHFVDESWKLRSILMGYTLFCVIAVHYICVIAVHYICVIAVHYSNCCPLLLL
jgi:hypothetical protein